VSRALCRATPTDAQRLRVVRHKDDQPGQFQIQNDHKNIQDWDREYVDFGGFAGVHSPELFATAPDLLAHLEFVVKLVEGFPVLRDMAQLDAMRAAIAKARSQ
jgi:hypothetical protein